ncbi:4-hydroxyacetophenone monooxygenase [Fonsecaea pedrosoi]|nr:4-hydroxyacetophenone monooxygenase [Fonsecaea pedrosoi]
MGLNRPPAILDAQKPTYRAGFKPSFSSEVQAEFPRQHATGDNVSLCRRDNYQSRQGRTDQVATYSKMPFVRDTTAHSAQLEYDIENLYHSQITRPIRIICVGSGISGMCLAFTIMKRLKSYELTIYEKNKDVGGTKCLGVAKSARFKICQLYHGIQSTTGASTTLILQRYTNTVEVSYLLLATRVYITKLSTVQDFYERYNIDQFTKLEHKVKRAVWDDATGQWRVSIEDLATGNTFQDTGDILVNATGFLNKWTWPHIEGIDKFRRPKVHSAAWDDSIDFHNKTIGVIGSGSSAIQIVPQMQKGSVLSESNQELLTERAAVAKDLKVFMRSPTWITPAIGGQTSSQFQGDDNPGHQQFTFTEEQKERFRSDPEYHLQFRRKIEAEVNWMADVFKMGSKMQQDVQKMMTQQMKARIGPGHDELGAKLIPQWPPGCRRLTPGDRYLESLVESNVEPVFGDILRLDDTAVVMMDGTRHEVDVLVCATGFDVSFVTSFEILGRDGLNIKEAWKDIPDAYLGLAAPNFPNYFIICGPQGPLGNGSILPAIEVICDYISTVALKMQAERIKSLEPKRIATDQFQEHMHKFHKKSVWGQPCRSWYKNGKIDGAPQLWCGTALSYIKTIRNPRFEDFDIEYESTNRWAFLGNGKIQAHNGLSDGTPDIQGLAPYIRNADTPWEI